MKEFTSGSIEVGTTFEHQFEYSQADVVAFAEVTGDKNPIHLDEDYAKHTPFGRRILHGFLGASIFSKVFGTLFPGEGTIYLKQSMSFFKPMYTGTQYTAVFTVAEVFPQKRRGLIKTEIMGEDSKVVVSGEALIMHESLQ